jgi:hypothetical protein
MSIAGILAKDNGIFAICLNELLFLPSPVVTLADSF